MPREEFAGRYTSVYFATPDDMKYWNEVADKRGMSLSSLVLAGLENLQREIEAAPRADLARENETLKAENASLRKEIRLQSGLIEKYESELYRARHAAFQEISPQQPEGSRAFDLELIHILKTSRKPVDSGSILTALRIDPNDMVAIRLVRNQLEALDRYGLISESSHGWRWKK